MTITCEYKTCTNDADLVIRYPDGGKVTKFLCHACWEKVKLEMVLLEVSGECDNPEEFRRLGHREKSKHGIWYVNAFGNITLEDEQKHSIGLIYSDATRMKAPNIGVAISPELLEWVSKNLS